VCVPPPLASFYSPRGFIPHSIFPPSHPRFFPIQRQSFGPVSSFLRVPFTPVPVFMMAPSAVRFSGVFRKPLLTWFFPCSTPLTPPFCVFYRRTGPKVLRVRRPILLPRFPSATVPSCLSSLCPELGFFNSDQLSSDELDLRFFPQTFPWGLAATCRLHDDQ